MSSRILQTVLILLSSHLAGAQQSTYIVDTIAGSDTTQDGGVALNAWLDDVRGVTVDLSGNVYIADTARHRVARITSDGKITYIAGNQRPGFSGDTGLAVQAMLNQPYGLAIDSAGNLYIADLQNARIRRVSPDGRIQTVAGGGSGPLTTPGTLATEITLKSPRNVAVDPAGNLYIADFEDQRILRITRDGRAFVLAGTGIAGAAADSVSALAGTFSYPAGVAVDGTGNVYVADSGNHAVRRIAGDVMTTVRFPSDGLINLPTGLAVDNRGTLFVASSGFDQAVRLTAAGTAELLARGARDIAVDSNGNVYLAAGNFVRKVNPSGLVTTIAGTRSQFRGDDGPAAQALLFEPSDAKPDRAGGWIIADTGNHRIRRISPTGLITTIAGDGESGFAGDGGPALAARLASPQGVAVDSSGNIFIADTENHRVRRITSEGVITTVAGTGSPGFNGDLRAPAQSQLSRPAAVAIDSNGWLVIADTGNHRVRRVINGNLMVVIAGDGTAGFGGDGGSGKDAQLNNPRGLSIDSEGSIFIADATNYRVRKLSTTGVIATAAGNGSMGFSGDGGPARQAGFGSIRGVAADAQGALYIADGDNLRIRQVASGIVRTIAGSGLRGFSGDGGAALDARFDDPAGIAVDSAGSVAFADRLNHRIRKLTAGTPAVSVAPPVTSEIRALHGAILETMPIAPGMVLALKAPGIGPASPVSGTLGPGGTLDTSIGGVQVRFDGRAVPILYAQSDLINVQVPYRIASQLSTLVEIMKDSRLHGQTTLTVAASMPGIYTTNGGAGPAAAVNEDFSLNSVAMGAALGSVVTFYITGEGLIDPSGIDGKPSEYPYPVPLLPVQVRIGGGNAELVSAFAAVTSPGITQISARVPANTPPGAQPLTIIVGGTSSQAGVTLFIKP